MKNASPLPKEFLSWQVALRHHTMVARNGAPHVGVVPVVAVRRPGGQLGVSHHSIVCGLLPHERVLEAKTREFRNLYEGSIEAGARKVYDVGVEYLIDDYYASTDAFDPTSLTSLVPRECSLVEALRSDPTCSLIFNVFEISDPDALGNPRCTQVDCIVEILSEGEIFENVWWHNTLFHGKADEQVVLRFVHRRSWDNRFGGQVALRS